MITVVKTQDVDGSNIEDNRVYYELFCLSTDQKPTTHVATGSCAVEVDTTDVYFFDEASGTWLKAGD